MALQTPTGGRGEGIGTFKGYMVPPDLIEVDPTFNPRKMDSPDTLAHIAGLEESIKVRGFDPDRPLLGYSRGDCFIVTDGHCRLAAVQNLIARGLEIQAIPVRTETRGTSPADRLALALREPGHPLTYLESADAIKRLLAFGWNERQIGERCGKTRQWVLGCLDLAAAPQAIQEAVVKGELAATEGIRISRQNADPEAMLEAGRAEAKKRGSQRIRPRDIKTGRSRPQTPAQKAIAEFLRVLAAWPEAPTWPPEVLEALHNMQKWV